jgi:hypothetical protein
LGKASLCLAGEVFAWARERYPIFIRFGENAMHIIEGDFQGRSGRFMNTAFKGPIIKISTGMMQSVEYKVPTDIATLKLLHMDQRLTFGRFIVIVLLGITLIGLLLAIHLLIVWRHVDFSVGIMTKDGNKFVARGNSNDWAIAKKYVGMGSLEAL